MAAPLNLSLDECIRRGLEENIQAKIEKLKLDKAKVVYEISFHRNFLPTLAFQFNSSKDKTTYHIPGANTNLDTQSASNYPDTELYLSLESYNLFSSWQNAVQYKIDKMTYERARSTYNEQIRNAKLQIADAYFDLANKQLMVRFGKRVVKESTAITELYETKVKLGKASEDDLRSATLDLEDAQRNLGTYESQRQGSIATLANLIGDKENSEIFASTQLEYAPLNLTYSSLKGLIDGAPQITDAKNNIMQSELQVENLNRQKVPLPTLSIRGVVWGTNQTYGTQSSDISTGGAPDGNLDVTVALTWRIPLWDETGTFGSRALEQARIEKMINQHNGQKSFEEIRKEVIQNLNELNQIEANIKSLEKSRAQAEQLMISKLSQITKGQLNFLEIRSAMSSWTQIETELQTKFKDHFSIKVKLLQLLGITMLPGEKTCEYAYCIES